MACSIERNKKGEIEEVYAPNKKPSILYRDIVSSLDITKDQAVRLWAQTYTKSFSGLYEGEMDVNGEAIYSQAKDILSPFVDEVYYANSTQGTLSKLGQRYNMNYAGFMPRTINSSAVERELRASSLGHVKVKRATSGAYYFTIDNRFYNPFNPSFQLTAKNIPVDAELDRMVGNFLNSVGAKVSWVGQLEHDAAARVNTLNKVIEVVQSKQGLDTLTEEATHLMVSMMRGSAPYYAMAQQIKKFPVYNEVQETYGDLENYDPTKVTEEAIVKLITSVAVDRYADGTLKNWWNAILDYLRKLFKQQDISEFRKSAEKLLAGNVEGLQETLRDDIFYQISPNSDKKNFILDKIKEVNELKLENRDGRYYIPSLDKWVRFRPSDKVQDYGRYIYGQKEFTPEYKEYFTTKGTILHNYNQLIMETLLSNAKDINREQIESLVYNNLKDRPEFKNFQDRSYYKLSTTQWSDLFHGVKSIYTHIKEKDSKATILTEQVVYNPKDQVNDIAGTIDVMVIYSDGTIGIYDYKSMRFPFNSKTKDYSEVQDSKRQLFDLQLSQYKSILKESWGLTDSDFRETRIVPINMQFKIGGRRGNQAFEKVEMGRPSLNKDYLDQLTVADEQVAGDDNLNIFLNKLYQERNKLRAEVNISKGDKKKKLNARLSKLNNTINDLIVKQDISGALSDIASIIEDVENNNNLSAGQILEYKEFIELYDTFNTAFKQSLDQLEDKEDVIQRIRYYNDMLDAARVTINQKLIDLAQTMSERSLLDGGKLKTGLGQIFDGISEWNHPVIFTIGTVLAEQREKVVRRLLEEDESIDTVHDEYVAWAKRNGFTGINAFKPLIRASDGNLITRFKKEFYEEKNKIAEQGRTKYYNKEDITKEREWFESHYEFNEERWKEDYDKVKELLAGNPTYSPKDRARELSKMDAVNPKKNNNAWFATKNWYIRPKDHKDPAQASYISDEWAFISKPGNEPAMKYYEMYSKYNREMNKMIGHEVIRDNFVANIHASTIEKMGTLGVFKENTLLQDMYRGLEVREYDHLFGTVDKDGNPINKIPILYLDKLKREVTAKEKVEIENDVATQAPRGSKQFFDEVDRRVNELAFQKGVADKSKDLTQSLKLMYRSALDYHYKSEVEDSIRLLREIVTLDQYTEIPTDRYNNPILNKLTGTLAKRMGASNTTEEIIDKFIKLHLYGQRIQSKDSTFRMGDKVYSTTKIIQLAQNFLSIKALGLNPILAGASNIGAQINRNILAGKGIYFGENTWKEALDQFTSSDEKTLAAIWFFEPSSRDLSYDRALKKSVSGANKALNMRNVFALHRGLINKRGKSKYDVDNPYFGDDNVDNTILLAMMKHWVLDSDGKLKSKGDPLKPIKDENAKTLWEIFDSSGDVMKLEGISEKEFVRFRRLVAEAQNRVKGSLTEDQMHIANTQVLSMMLMKFRNWMPGLIKERFGSFRYNPLLESYEQGHFIGTKDEILPSMELIRSEQEAWSMSMGTIFGDLILPTLKNFISLGSEVITMGLYKHKIDEKKAEIHRRNFLKKNPDLDEKEFTLERFIDFRRRQWRTMARELRYLLGMSTLLLGAMSALGWDDEDENLLTYNMYKLAQRASLELSFFFSMDSVNEILKSPLPVMRLTTDFSNMIENFLVESSQAIGITPENTRDKTPFGYYTLKNIPGINQILGMAAYFNQDQSKGTFEKIFGESTFFQDYILSR